MSKNRHRISARSPKEPGKSAVEVLVAKYGLLGTIVAALLGVVSVSITAYFGYLGIRAQIQGPVNVSQTAQVQLTTTPLPQVTPCHEWTLASDFQIWPQQENPNRDSCGNINVWHFLSGNDLNRNPRSYYLFQDFVADARGRIGRLQWRNPGVRDGGVYFNASGAPIGSWPPNTILIHTDNARLVVIGWRSPVNGNVKVIGFVVDSDTDCGDGINWYISQNSTELAIGYIDNGGGQEFQNGLGGDNLASISINQGEFIYLALHPREDDKCDATLVYFTVSR